MTDTIVAVATGAGAAGVGVVRLSGPDAFAIASSLCRVPSPPHARLRRIVVRDPQTGETLDDGLLAAFHAPRSFTGEDVAELQIHGGPLTLRRVVGACVAAGARLARPGEFSERAFLNGKLDLAQAEGIADQIAARSDAARRAARRQVDGALGAAVRAACEPLHDALARIEASIDFPEEVGEIDRDAVAEAIRAARGGIDSLLAGAAFGRRLSDGATIALVGAPNAGKSSLLNALAGADRAIVTELPGTTRDVLRETLDLAGIPVTVLDTAGLRESDDAVERIGVARARAAMADADLVLLVVDATAPHLPDGLAPIDARRLTVVNKCDAADPAAARERVGDPDAVAVSALRGDGLDALVARVVHRLTGGAAVDGDLPLVTRARHEAALKEAARSLDRSAESAVEGQPAELIAVDLHDALRHLGEITGATSREEIVAGVFARFCLGK